MEGGVTIETRTAIEGRASAGLTVGERLDRLECLLLAMAATLLDTTEQELRVAQASLLEVLAEVAS